MCAVRVEARIPPHKTNHHESRGGYTPKSRFRARPDNGSPPSSISGMVHSQSQNRRRTRLGRMCGSNQEVSTDIFTHEEFWIRNKCKDSFLSVLGDRTKARVVAHSGGRLSVHNSEVKVIKETFKCPGDGLLDPVQTRLYHPESNKYVCFNRRGRVRAVSKTRANRMGPLCSFYEISVDMDSFHKGSSSSSSSSSSSPWSSTSPISERHRFVQYQSVYGRQRRSEVWLLGFHQKRSRAKRLPNGDLIYLPKPMLKRRRGSLVHRNIREDSCEFMFSTGKYSPTSPMIKWGGLFAHVEKAHLREQSPALDTRAQVEKERKSPSRRLHQRRRPGRDFSASRKSSTFSSSSSSLSKNRLQPLKGESLLEQHSDIDVISELSPSYLQSHNNHKSNNDNKHPQRPIDSHSDFMKQHEENLLQ